jgi:hypothetical protein
VSWSVGERLLLLQAVEHFGPHAWSDVAEAVRVVSVRLALTPSSTGAATSNSKMKTKGSASWPTATACKDMFEQLSLQHENLDAHAAQLKSTFVAEQRRRIAQLELDVSNLQTRLAAAKSTAVADESNEHNENVLVDIETEEPVAVPAAVAVAVVPPPPPAPVVVIDTVPALATTPAAAAAVPTRRGRRRSGEEAAVAQPTPTSRGSSRVASRAASPSPSPLPLPVVAQQTPAPLDEPAAAERGEVSESNAAVSAAAASTPSAAAKRSTPHRAAAPQSDPLAVILRALMKDERASWFIDPVDASVAGQYNEVIREPLHLRAIALSLEQDPAPSAEHVWAALLHVFYNAFVFNDPQSEVFQSAHELRCIAAKLMLPHLPPHAASYASALAALSPVHRADGHEVDLRMPKLPKDATKGATPNSQKRKR